MNEILVKIISEYLENPNQLVEIINQFKPLAYAVASSMFEIYKDYVQNDEHYKTTAESTYKTYESLIDAGFSKTQAFELLKLKLVSSNSSLSSSLLNHKSSKND